MWLTQSRGKSHEEQDRPHAAWLPGVRDLRGACRGAGPGSYQAFPQRDREATALGFEEEHKPGEREPVTLRCALLHAYRQVCRGVLPGESSDNVTGRGS